MGIAGIDEEISYRNTLRDCQKNAKNLNPETITPREVGFMICEKILFDEAKSLCYVMDEKEQIWGIPYTASTNSDKEDYPDKEDYKVMLGDITVGCRVLLRITGTENTIITTVLMCRP